MPIKEDLEKRIDVVLDSLENLDLGHMDEHETTKACTAFSRDIQAIALEAETICAEPWVVSTRAQNAINALQDALKPFQADAGELLAGARSELEAINSCLNYSKEKS